MKIAIVGSGISGLAVAHRLQGHAELSLFEAGSYFGGHTHTVDVTLPSAEGAITHGVDTGFLVFNERTYPQLIALFAELGVETAKSDMSFSVQVPRRKVGRRAGVEWLLPRTPCLHSAATCSTPAFCACCATCFASTGWPLTSPCATPSPNSTQPLSAFLEQHALSAEFRDWYFLPMLGCIWSCPTDQMLRFPVATMVRFCHNHGLIQISNRPQWWTVRGGARHYVDKIVARIADKRLNAPVQQIVRDAEGVWLAAAGQTQRFDKVVMACHSDQSLSLLQSPTAAERAVLGAIRYQPNVAVLHTDTSVLPKQGLAWAAWNYQRAASGAQTEARVCLHYLLNRLQPLPFAQSVVVSLNPVVPIAPAHVHGQFEYAHPVFDQAAIAAQSQVAQLQGQRRTDLCGAWTGYGFHEDWLSSGLDAARRITELLGGSPA